MGTNISQDQSKRILAREKRANGEGSVYPKYLKSGKKKYVAAWFDINGKYHRKTFDKQSEALDHLYKMKQERKVGRISFAANPKMIITDFLNQWLSSRANLKPETRRNYQGAISNRVDPFIGKVTVGSINPSVIEHLYQVLDSKGYKAGTLNVTHAVLSAAFADATRLNLIPYNPMERVKRITKKSLPSKHIPRQDAERIYAAAKLDPYTHARIDLGIYTGLRPGEVFGLQWKHLDYSAKTLTIEVQVQRVKGQGLVLQSVKTNDVRTIPLTDDQIRILQAHQFHQITQSSNWESDEGLMFPNSLGRKMDPKRDHKNWVNLLKKAGVKKHYTRYQMRKTAFTNLATSGVDLRTVMEISGHKQVSTLINSYIHPTTESMKAALGIQDLLRQATPSFESVDLDRQLQEWFEQVQKIEKARFNKSSISNEVAK